MNRTAVGAPQVRASGENSVGRISNPSYVSTCDDLWGVLSASSQVEDGEGLDLNARQAADSTVMFRVR